MAKKKEKGAEPDLDYGQDEEGGGFAGFLLALAIIVIWLAVFALLIKMNVGGIGSMLRPVLKNVPVVNMILPDPTDEEVIQETGYKYKNLADAIERIKELENELAGYQESGALSAEQIALLQAEVERLRVFEENQEYYYQLKEKFDSEIVYTDNAPDIENYKTWYEKISPENAEKLYKEVVQKLQYSAAVKEWAATFGDMKPARAARILEEMTGDTDLVAAILLNLKTQQRADIMAEMDSVFAAKITKIMYP